MNYKTFLSAFLILVFGSTEQVLAQTQPTDVPPSCNLTPTSNFASLKASYTTQITNRGLKAPTDNQILCIINAPAAERQTRLQEIIAFLNSKTTAAPQMVPQNPAVTAAPAAPTQPAAVPTQPDLTPVGSFAANVKTPLKFSTSGMSGGNAYIFTEAPSNPFGCKYYLFTSGPQNTWNNITYAKPNMTVTCPNGCIITKKKDDTLGYCMVSGNYREEAATAAQSTTTTQSTEKVVAQVSAPGFYVRDIPQNFPVTLFGQVTHSSDGLISGFNVTIGNYNNVKIPATNYSQIETPGGTRTFQALISKLYSTKTGTQIFVECKDSNGCQVTCNNPSGNCASTGYTFKGKYRITMDGFYPPSMNEPARPFYPYGKIATGAVITGKYTGGQFMKSFTINTANFGQFALDFTKKVNQYYTTKSPLTNTTATITCKESKGCWVICNDPNNTRCKNALGKQVKLYDFTGQYEVHFN